MERPVPRAITVIDWGASPRKRASCRAVLASGRFRVEQPGRVETPAELVLEPSTLTAFDVPIGLPQRYADRMRLASFREALAVFGAPGDLERFYEIAASRDQISPEQPFYPAKPLKGVLRADLIEALGEDAFAMRACDRETSAGPLFWLVGAKQVGRSAIQVWRDVLAPRRDALFLWPFDGELEDLLFLGRPVVAEIYPPSLRAPRGWEPRSKRDPRWRQEVGRKILALDEPSLDLSPVRALLDSGFGPSPSAEDDFDAVTACIALTLAYLEGKLREPPVEARVIEGWMLGL